MKTNSLGLPSRAFYVTEVGGREVQLLAEYYKIHPCGALEFTELTGYVVIVYAAGQWIGFHEMDRP